MRPVSNPPNPWSSTHVDWLGDPPPARLEVYEEEAKSILSHNDSPDVGFSWSVNAYRGCYHGCIYCYARPSHQHLGFGAGTDFERRIVVKTNAVSLLREAFLRPSWKGEPVAFSGVTDAYQPLEAAYRLTRGLLETCAEFRNPVQLITKGALIRRDVDILQQLHRDASARVYVSIPVLDPEVARITEPNASTPRQRLDAVRALADAGVPVGVAVAPIIPGLTESHVVPLLEAAADAGARHAFIILLRLPSEVLPVFEERVTTELSASRVRHVFSAMRDMRDGRDNVASFGARMVGTGPRWEALRQSFHLACRRLGLDAEPVPEVNTFRRPERQLSMPW